MYKPHRRKIEHEYKLKSTILFRFHTILYKTAIKILKMTLKCKRNAIFLNYLMSDPSFVLGMLRGHTKKKKVL